MATIPQPKKHDEAAKKQHLIPRCYVKPWYIGSSESVWAYNKKEKYHSGVNLSGILNAEISREFCK